MIETEIDVPEGHGSLGLRLCDGHDWVEVLLPVGEPRLAEAFSWRKDGVETMTKLGETETSVCLRPGQRYRAELAFVDRRLNLAIDGQVRMSIDLPQVKRREGVDCPFQMRADGVSVRLHRFRLYRDLHYGQQGHNGVHGKSVRLGVDQYFVLGDNSPNSHDSRFWPNQGRIEARDLVGSAWLTYGRRPLRE
jgi:signal peptidase I